MGTPDDDKLMKYCLTVLVWSARGFLVDCFYIIPTKGRAIMRTIFD
jgi:hypothetical protein